MKKLLILSVITVIGFLPFHTKAQVQVSINIGSQPDWGPAGYNYVDYYYLPEIESYYYVPTRQFIYLSNGSWVFGVNLPQRYRGYDLYRGYKVVMNSPRPYYHFKQHRYKYRNYRNHRVQPYIGHGKHTNWRQHKSYKRHNQHFISNRSSHFEKGGNRRGKHTFARGKSGHTKNRGNYKGHGRHR